MKRRIKGTEIEWGRRPVFEDHKTLNVRDLVMFRASPLSNAMRSAFEWELWHSPMMTSADLRANARRVGMSPNIFWKNQTRFYLDTGSHPETAQAECTSGKDVVRQEKANERNLKIIASALTQEKILGIIKDDLPSGDVDDFLDRVGKTGGFTFLKNNKGHRNKDTLGEDFVWGKHLSIGSDRERLGNTGVFERLGALIAPFTIVSRTWSGNGFLEFMPSGLPRFYLSQRAPHIREITSGATTSSRSYVNTRDEPHADIRDESLPDTNKYRRLHLIPFDSHVSEVVIWLETELVALLVEMLEEGFFERGASWVYDYCLDRNSVDLAKELVLMSDTINEDLTLCKLVQLGRQERTAIHFLRHYSKLFRRYQKKHGLSSEQGEAADRFDLLIEQLDAASKTDAPEESLIGFNDWAAKLCLLKTTARKRDKDLFAVRSKDLSGRKTKGNDPDKLCSYLEKVDDDFHDVRDSGGHNRMDRMGLFEHVVTEESIIHAMENPPKDTRAALRGYYEELADKRGLLIKLYAWHWDGVEATTTHGTPPGMAGFKAKLDDPFQTEP